MADVAVDIGPNLTNLIEQLAKQIGVTTDTIFPWYVKQQLIEGYAFFGLTSLALIVGTILLLLFAKKADWNEGNVYIVPSMIGLALWGIVCMSYFLFFSQSIAQIFNPEFAAMQDLIAALGHLK